MAILDEFLMTGAPVSAGFHNFQAQSFAILELCCIQISPLCLKKSSDRQRGRSLTSHNPAASISISVLQVQAVSREQCAEQRICTSCCSPLQSGPTAL